VGQEVVAVFGQELTKQFTFLPLLHFPCCDNDHNQKREQFELGKVGFSTVQKYLSSK